MQPPENADATRSAVDRELPPLILHPFNERVTPSDLLENSKAALMLSGALPRDGVEPEELSRRLLAGRYAEIRMLFFLGRDIFRWIEQCMEWGRRFAGAETPCVTPQSVARLLTQTPPQEVRDKLLRWGVTDHSSIFSRAIGLHAVFTEPPESNALSDEFVRDYHRYTDALFRAYMQGRTTVPVAGDPFHFELYASGEYSRKLESEWGE